MEMRHRKFENTNAGGGDGDDDEGGKKDDGEEKKRGEASASQQQSPIEQAIASVVEYVGYFFSKLSKFISSKLNPDEDNNEAGKINAKLTESDLETAVDIRSRLDVKYDETRREHVEMLEILWRSCFEEDGVEFPSSSSSSTRQPRLGHASEKWKDMGWQGTHPSTDLRGCGVFALENLVYFSRTRKDAFKILVEKKNGKRSDWEYPFAAAGVNVTHELTKLLDVDGIIKNGSVNETLRVDKCVVGFFELVRRTRTTTTTTVTASSSDNSNNRNGSSGHPKSFVAAFHELYCDAFEILDEEWLLAKATYMEFPKVLERTIRVKVREKLERLAEEAPTL